MRLLCLFAMPVISGCMATPGPEYVRDPWQVAFLQACADATRDGLVINLAAHPDDESARTLVYLRRHGVRTVTIYSTCGDGGQNAIGREIGPALAFLRTRETLAAAQYTGTQVRWLGFADFGYSKTAAETFRTWGKDAYMRGLDQIVTAVRPDIAFTNHSPGRGHGHHRASVLALRELMEQKFEQGWVVPVYQRDFNDAEAWQVKFPVGQIDPITGHTYARQAYRGWRQHRTQGVFGPFSGNRRRQDKWGIVHPKGLDGHQLWDFFGSVFRETEFLEHVQREGIDATALEAEFDAFGQDRPAVVHVDRARKLLPEMLALRAKLSDGTAGLRLDRRIDALQRVLMLGSGVTITAQLSRGDLAPGTRGVLYLQVKRTGAIAPAKLSAEFLGVKTSGRNGQIRVPFGPLKDVAAGDVKPGWFYPSVTFDLDGVSICREVPVRYTPVERVALDWQRNVFMIPANRSGGQIDVPIDIVWNGDQQLTADLTVTASDGVVAKVTSPSVALPARSATQQKMVSIVLPPEPLRHDVTLTSRLESGTSPLQLRLVDANPPKNLSVGLIRGPDESLQWALHDLDIPYTLFKDGETLSDVDLAQFRTLVLDIRAYHHRGAFLKRNRDAILAYCKAGGRIVCFYHKPYEWNPTAQKLALSPFEILVGTQRVCEERAAVEFVDSKHRILNYPNRLGPQDFEGWVQERGLNFPMKWAKEWTPLLRMHDTGENPLDGSLLYAKDGEGDYLYCSLALYRQLARGHPGAARILVNLLSQ